MFSSKKIPSIFIFFGIIVVSATTADAETDELEFRIGNLPYDPKIEASTLDLIRNAGYPAEDHIITTDDGYLLTIHRIPNEKGSPIFIQHGLLSSSADWLTLGEGKALPYLLADLGYDVWLGNYRGNAFARAHVNLSSSSREYWDFSWHEMGIYDLPAMINYVTSRKAEKVVYIGHSMGTTGMFVMATERPDMQNKVKLIICLAPVAYVFRAQSPVRILAPITDKMELIDQTFVLSNFLSQYSLINMVTRFACSSTTLGARLCTNILFAICGFDPFQIDYSQLKIIASRTASGSSTKSLIHYLQGVSSHRFRQYDYGPSVNVEKYGSTTPPDYDLSKLIIPVAFFYGDNDWLAAVPDVLKLYNELPNGILIERIDFTFFNHLDFLWAKDARDLLYGPMIKLIQNFQ